MDKIERITHELARVDEGKLRAYSDKDRVIFMIKDAPVELRKLAEALEKINVREIQALVAYPNPSARKDPGGPERDALRPAPAKKKK
jgi:hypothetical protein